MNPKSTDISIEQKLGKEYLFLGCHWCLEVDPNPDNDPIGAIIPKDANRSKIVKGCLMETAECNYRYQR